MPTFKPGEKVAHGRRVGTVTEGECRWPRCRNNECVTVLFEGQSTTENREAEELTRL